MKTSADVGERCVQSFSQQEARFRRRSSFKIRDSGLTADASNVLKTIRSILSTSNGNGANPIPWFNANDTAIAGAMASGSPGAGSPAVRALECLASADGAIASGVWESTAGKHQFQFDFDEILYFIEGEVNVTAGGKTYTFRAGDVAFVPAGVQMTWEVPKYVRKIWTHRYPRLALLRRALRKLRQVAFGAPLGRENRSGSENLSPDC
jgi:uncharacterized cupin superfamily protein